ncbi:Replicase polyprotein 1ab, partial [Dissostichus eleginoides]
ADDISAAPGQHWGCSISSKIKEDFDAKGHRKDHTGFPGRRCLVQNTKKMDCPATINVVHLMKFPEYKISVNNEKGKREASQQLKQALKDDQSKVKTVELLSAYFPKTEEHQNHPVLGQGCGCPTRRRFYPLDKDIWNIIQRTKASTRRSNIDQVNLSESTSDIKEALQVLKDLNPDWKPSHFMVDFFEAEICALEEVFNDSKVILCDFHREKAWVEWTRKGDP